MDNLDEHEHLSKAHFAHDQSHGDHHEEVFSEVDVSPNGILKAPSAQILFFAVITFILLLAWPVFAGRVLYYRRDSDPFHYLCYLFSPPLRAPPL